MLHQRHILAGAEDQTESLNAQRGRFNRFEIGVLTTKNYNNFGDSSRKEVTPNAQRSDRRAGDLGLSSGLKFSTGNHGEDDSEVSSPPLWKTSLPENPTAKVSSSTTSQQTQEIAKGRRELMEMIQNVPESAYELSLKDIVELPTIAGENRGKGIQEEKRINHKKKINNKEKHVQGEFLLKMFVPYGIGQRRRRSSNGTCSRVSPKPQHVEGEKIVDNEWWKRRSFSAGHSSRTSRSSSSNNGSRRLHKDGSLLGCWSIFNKNKNH